MYQTLNLILGAPVSVNGQQKTKHVVYRLKPGETFSTYPLDAVPSRMTSRHEALDLQQEMSKDFKNHKLREIHTSEVFGYDGFGYELRVSIVVPESDASAKRLEELLGSISVDANKYIKALQTQEIIQ